MEANTILIIEDDAGLIDLLSERIGDHGYQIYCVQSAKKALEWLNVHTPFLMILDFSLPDMNGKEFILELKTKRDVPPFIVSTGQGDERIAVDMMKLGARDYIIKDNHFLEMIPLVIRKVGSAIENEIKLKLAEQALVESNQFNKQIIQSAQEGIIVYDLDLKIQLWNPFMEDLMGISASDVVGKRPVDLYPFLKDIGVIEIIEKVLHGEIVPEIDVLFNIVKSGKSGWISETIAPLLNVANEIVGVIGTVRNITERKRAEEVLRQSEENYRLITEKISDVVWLMDLIGHSLFVSHSIEKFTGYSVEEYLSQKIQDRFTSDSSLVALETLKSEVFLYSQSNDLLKDYKKTMILDYRCKDGSTKTGEVLITPYFDENNKCIGLHGVTRDITERRQAEKALRESEERYRSFISQVSEGVYRFESDQPMDISLPIEEQVDFIYDHMFIAECNNALIKMYGLSNQADIIGKGHLDFHGGRHNHVNRELLRKFVTNNYRFENGISEEFNSAGQRIFISNNSLGVIENNHLVRMWGTQIDVTEKTKAEQVQNVLYAISNAALSSNDLQELIEIISVQLGKLLDVTNFYIAFYDEATGMLSTNYEKDEKDHFNSWPAEKSATGYVIKHQKSFLRRESDFIELCKAGEIELVGSPSKIWLGVPLFANKKAIGAIVVQSYENEDAYTENDKLMLEFISGQISIAIERKKADQELIKALAQAQESDLLKSAFLANMSHEIRTPMNGILGFAGLLSEPGLTGEDQAEYISIIEKSGARMLNIINDIISISKVESGLMEVVIAETNINEQIEYIYTFFKPECVQKGLKLFYKNSLPNDKALIKTDKEKIYAVLTNLVKNAIKFTDEGSIEFGYDVGSVCRDKACLVSTPPTIEFYVKDTGIGVPKHRQEAIFDRFVQADIADVRAFQGAGLGLSISKAYIELLGGKIWVESDTDGKSGKKGSVFYFTIPYLTDKVEIMNVPVRVAEDQPNPEGLSLKILIAEDDMASSVLITLTIKKFAKEILKARTGIEAVEICRNNPDIDLILMDIKMPLLDGIEATRQIRQFNSGVIIIAQTAFALTGAREKVIDAGCNDYISKPVLTDKLIELVQKYFNK